MNAGTVEGPATGTPHAAGPLMGRLRRKLDWTYALLAWTGIAAPLAMLAVDDSGEDLISLAIEAVSSPSSEAVIYRLVVVLTLVSEVAVSAAAIVLGARFRRRRMLLALVLTDVAVVMRHLIYPVVDELFPASAVAHLASRGPVLLYGVTCIATCVAWFARGRRRFGSGATGVADVRAQLADPFWPSSAPISRSQQDLAYGCFAWATFGWQLAWAVAVHLQAAAVYFLQHVLPGTAVVAAGTGLWLWLRVRRDRGLAVLALLALGVAGVVVSSQVVQRAGLTALLAEAQADNVSAGGAGLAAATLLVKWLGWTFDAAAIIGPLLVMRWCFRARLSRETFDPQREWQAWTASSALMPSERAPAPRGAPDARRAPRVASKVTFWWYVAVLVVALATFLHENAVAFELMWGEFRSFAKDEPAVIGQLAPVLFFYGLAVSYGRLLLEPPIWTFPLAAFTAWRWRRPPSILLLRPFHQRRASRALAKVIRRDLATAGHVYSLADTDIHVPWYVTLTTLLGQASILSFGYREIARPRQLERLIRSLRGSWWRTVNWAVSWRKVFPISTTDSAWVPVVRTLLQRVDVVVIDVSVWRPNVVRELDLCAELAVLPRVVCLVRASGMAAARARLDQEERWRDVPLHPYDDTGSAPTLRAGLPPLRQRPGVLQPS